MSTHHLVFDIHSYWHAGSGRGRDAVLDAEVIRDSDGLPYLPGKTIKGLLRKAMTTSLLARGESTAPVHELLGSDVPGTADATDGDEQTSKLEEGRFSTTPGCLWIGSATLPPTWAQWLRTAPDRTNARDVLAALFRTVASTAIDGEGVAREHTLRVSEVTVPMTLRAQITNTAPADRWPPDRWLPLVRNALPYLRSLGVRRRRGYGRVSVTLEAPPKEMR